MLPDLIMAPIAEHTNSAFRSLVRSYSKEVLLHSEMLSAASILHGAMFNNVKSQIYDFDPPFTYQLLGNDPEIMSEAAVFLSENEPFSIDLNFGCSAPDIRKKGLGGGLLKQPELVRQIVTAVRKKITIPMSAKIRTGFDSVNIDQITEFTKMLQDCGCDYITVHPRTAKQHFKRRADWSIIQKIKEELSIPVVGNGDVESVDRASSYIAKGYCDSVMIARAALQKPWIFREYELMRDGTGESLTVNHQEALRLFIDKLYQYLPEEHYTSRALRFFFYYCKNFKFGHGLFSKVRKEEDPRKMAAVVLKYLENNTNEQELVVTADRERR